MKRCASKRGEYEILKRLVKKLNLAVCSHILPLATELLAVSLITDENYRSLTNTKNDEVERAANLVKHVLNKVKLSSKNYHVFVKVLISERSTYKEILEDLEPIYKEPTDDEEQPDTPLPKRPKPRTSGSFSIGTTVVFVTVLVVLVAIVAVYWKTIIACVHPQYFLPEQTGKSVSMTSSLTSSPAVNLSKKDGKPLQPQPPLQEPELAKSLPVHVASTPTMNPSRTNCHEMFYVDMRELARIIETYGSAKL